MSTDKNPGSKSSPEIPEQPENLGLTEAQLKRVVDLSVEGAGRIAGLVAEATIKAAIPEMKRESEFAAIKAAAEAIARKEKLSTMKTLGVNIGTSLAVFITGTLAMAGYDKYQNSNRQRDRQQHPQ